MTSTVEVQTGRTGQSAAVHAFYPPADTGSTGRVRQTVFSCRPPTGV